MPDYNIYIRSIGGGEGQSNPTIPWSQREGGSFNQTTSQTSSNNGGINPMGAITKVGSFIQNPDSVVGAAISGLAKIAPYVAAAYLVCRVSDTIMNNVVEFNEINTGDYRVGNIIRNYAASMHNVTHPISSLHENFKIQDRWTRENKKARAERDLLGDSVVNSYSNRGV